MGESKRRKEALGFDYPKGEKHSKARGHLYGQQLRKDLQLAPGSEGVKIQVVARCNLEDDPREGKEIVIDLGDLEHPCLARDELYEFSECTEHFSDDPERPPELVCEYHFDIVNVRGLGSRLATLVSDLEGPALGTLEDLVSVLLCLPEFLWIAFFKWAESEEAHWWLPGYGVHAPEDAVFSFWSSRSSKEQKAWEPLIDFEPVIW